MTGACGRLVWRRRTIREPGPPTGWLPLGEDGGDGEPAVRAPGPLPQTSALRTDQTKLSYQKCISETTVKKAAPQRKAALPQAL